MASAFDRERQTYLKEIRRQIAFTGFETQRYLRDLTDRIDEFTEETGATEFSSVRAHFGTPEEIAQAFFEQTDPKAVKKRTSPVRILLIALLIMLLIAGAFYGAIKLDVLLHPGHGVETEAFDTPEAFLENQEETGKTILQLVRKD